MSEWQLIADALMSQPPPDLRHPVAGYLDALIAELYDRARVESEPLRAAALGIAIHAIARARRECVAR